MKKILFSFLVVAAIAAAPSKMLAQTNSANTPTSVTIINPITLTQVDGMSFGIIGVTAAASGDATLSTAGTVTLTVGGLTLQGGSSRSAHYYLSGDAGKTYAVTLPATISLFGGSGAPLIVSDLVAKCGTGADQAQGTITGTLDGTGVDEIKVGGKLTIPLSTTAADYTGTFPISVAYN